MKQDFTARVVGSFFLLGAPLLWVGWIALPVHIGTFFTTGDFATVHEKLTLWIWMYRLHIFGFVISVMALVALAGALPGAESREPLAARKSEYDPGTREGRPARLPSVRQHMFNRHTRKVESRHPVASGSAQAKATHYSGNSGSQGEAR